MSQSPVETDSASRARPAVDRRAFWFGYVLALVTAFLPFAAAATAVLAWRAGAVRNIPTFLLAPREEPYRSPVDFPEELVEELGALRAVVENAGNPTRASQHDTILVQPDSTLVYRLRPGARISNFMLSPADRWNIDPPVISMPTESVDSMSPALREFVDRHQIQASSYVITGDGFRRTLPSVSSPTKIVVVGDSGVFGIGVDDEHTIPSALQSRAGATAEVVNAGVGGYNAGQVLGYAEELLRRLTCETLIYVVHENDLGGHEPEELVERIAALRKDRERLHIVVAVLPEMEYMTFGLSRHWTQAEFESERVLMTTFQGAVERRDGIDYVDLIPAMKAHVAASGTAFAMYGLYVDHAHLSPQGTGLFADTLYAHLQTLVRQ